VNKWIAELGYIAKEGGESPFFLKRFLPWIIIEATVLAASVAVRMGLQRKGDERKRVQAEIRV
jgi:hypothetical protein